MSQSRKQAWNIAIKTLMQRLTSAKFLFATHHDRQTAAIHSHTDRVAHGALVPPPTDHSGLRTVGTDGESRKSTLIRAKGPGIKMYTPIAKAWGSKTYTPQPLRIVQWPKGTRKKPKKGIRTIAVPTVQDRNVGAVILEILEPLFDPSLSDFQHGYRSSVVAGKQTSAPGFPNIPRGSTEIVARRVLRAVRGGRHYLLEMDIENAFPSVSRAKLIELLAQEGCPTWFAKALVRSLGDTATKNGVEIPITGIPLGHPIGPLLFNFYVRGLHEGLTEGVHMCSYADNIFVAAPTLEATEEERDRISGVLRDLGLTAKIEQVANMNEADALFTVLKEWEITNEEGKARLKKSPTPKADASRRERRSGKVARVGTEASEKQGNGIVPLAAHGRSPDSSEVTNLSEAEAYVSVEGEAESESEAYVLDCDQDEDERVREASWCPRDGIDCRKVIDCEAYESSWSPWDGYDCYVVSCHSDKASVHESCPNNSHVSLRESESYSSYESTCTGTRDSSGGVVSATRIPEDTTQSGICYEGCSFNLSSSNREIGAGSIKINEVHSDLVDKSILSSGTDGREDGHSAEILFEARWRGAFEEATRRAIRDLGETRELVLVVPSWEVFESNQSYKKAKRNAKVSWQMFSRVAVKMGILSVGLILPADSEWLGIPGVFGTPLEFGGPGDEHWAISEPPCPKGQKGIWMTLRRLGRRPSKAEILQEGTHLATFCQPAKHNQFVCTIIGIIADGPRRGPLEPRTGPPRPNPTTATADALAGALPPLKGLEGDVTVWTHQMQIAERLAGEFEGYKNPDLERSALALQRAAKVSLKRAKHRGSMMQEILLNWVTWSVAAAEVTMPACTCRAEPDAPHSDSCCLAQFRDVI